MRSVIYKFDIVKHRKKIFILTLLIVAVSIISLFVRGLNLGVDFVSGTRLDIHVKPNVDLEKAQTVLTGLGYHDPDVRTGGSENEFVFSGSAIAWSETRSIRLKRLLKGVSNRREY